jgi:hypothetical protein
MSYSPDSLLTSPAQGAESWWSTVLARHGADLPATIASIYHRDAPLAGLNADLALETCTSGQRPAGMSTRCHG